MMYLWSIAILFLGENHRSQIGVQNICEYSENCLLYFFSAKNNILWNGRENSFYSEDVSKT